MGRARGNDSRGAGTNATSATDYWPTSEQQLCYRVIASNANGDSPPSNTDCTAPPAAPSGLTATVVDSKTVDLAWIDNSTVEDGYEVRRAREGEDWSSVADLPPNITPATTGGTTCSRTC